MDKKTETVAHVISDQDPQKCWNKYNEFIKSKDKQDLEIHWNTTPIVINQHGQSIIIPTCLIFWKCTPEQAKSFRNQQMLLLKS